GRRSAPALGLVNEHLCHPLGNSGAGRRAEGHLLRHRWHRHRFVWRWQPASLCGEVGTGRWPGRAAPHRPQCPAVPRAAATSLPPRFRLGNLVSRTTSAGLTREHTRMQETNAAALLEHLAGLLAERRRGTVSSTHLTRKENPMRVLACLPLVLLLLVLLAVPAAEGQYVSSGYVPSYRVWRIISSSGPRTS